MRSARLGALLLILTLAALACGGLLFLAPALLLVLPLLARRYPGERSLLRLAGRRRAPSAQRRRVQRPPRRPARRVLPRGGALIASSLAVRPPPHASLLAS
jgi:hypothetical protein